MQELYIDDIIEKTKKLSKEKKHKKTKFYNLIGEVVPDECHIHLSTKECTIIIFDEKKQSYTKAAVDYKSGSYQGRTILPTDEIFSLDNYKATSSIIPSYCFNYPSNKWTVGPFILFVKKIFTHNHSPVAEIGQLIDKDYPVKYYAPRTDKIPTIE